MPDDFDMFQGTEQDDELVGLIQEDEEDDAIMADLPREQAVILKQDILEAASLLKPSEARYLVTMYYSFQEKRKAAAAQERALSTDNEPHAVMSWSVLQVKRIEQAMYRLLDQYTATEQTGMGAWAREHVGIGPAISAALLSRIDVTKAPTAGHVWRYAGLDPRITWYGREKSRVIVGQYLDGVQNPKLSLDTLTPLAVFTDRRPERLLAMATDPKNGKVSKEQLIKGLSKIPWDAFLKLICWRMSQSFTYQANRPGCVYGQFKADYKKRILIKNANGDYAERCKQILASKNFSTMTDAYKSYSQGRLPLAHIEAMAKRWVAKLFLAHWHAEAYARHYGTPPPLPYPIAHMDHTHILMPTGERIAAAEFPGRYQR